MNESSAGDLTRARRRLQALGHSVQPRAHGAWRVELAPGRTCFCGDDFSLIALAQRLAPKAKRLPPKAPRHDGE